MNAQGSPEFRWLQCLGLLGAGVAGLYVVAYLLLSMFGQYRPMGMGGLSHWQEYSFWVPAGFLLGPEAERSSLFRRGMMYAFDPIWTVDVRWVHNRQDVYMLATRAYPGEWTYKTNSWLLDARGEWILTNFQPARAFSK